MANGMIPPQELIEILSRIRLRLCEAHGEKMSELQKWEAAAEACDEQKDSYGWNFNKGMTAGANYIDIFYHRIEREIQDVSKELDERLGTALQERVTIRRRETRRNRPRL